MQTVDWVQNAEWQFIYCFSSDSDNMSSYNLPSVTHQSLFRDHLLRSFALLGNISCPFLYPSRSYYNFKPSYSLLTLRAVNWCNVSTDFTNFIKIDVDVDVNKMSRAIFEKQSTALHVVRTFHLFNRYYMFSLLTKMRTETETVASTWYSFNVQGCTHTDFHISALYCHWLTWGTDEFRLGKARWDGDR